MSNEKVTGATVTDGDIYNANDTGIVDHDTCRIALYGSYPRRNEARARIAQILNTRNKAK